MTKGIKWLANLTTKIFYVLLFLLIVIGPTVYILNITNVGMGYWLDRFWTWALDPYLAEGKALVTWWTMYDWAIWIAYAPPDGYFFAMIAYGRTIKQFLLINWVLPAVFGLVWFSVWGGTALRWQMDGQVDIVAAIKSGGSRSRYLDVPAVYSLWQYFDSGDHCYSDRSFFFHDGRYHVHDHCGPVHPRVPVTMKNRPCGRK